MIVSDIAGTTRDAIDTDVVHDGKEYIFIDTAGLRRKNKIKEELERYSIIRTVTAVERADVVLMVIDAVEGVTEQDAKIAGIAHERGKGIIIVVNKWDSNVDHSLESSGKAGRERWLGRRPRNRGVVMNPVDHPMGGGEGRASGGHPRSRKGLLAKGYKTRNPKKTTSKFIISRKKK